MRARPEPGKDDSRATPRAEWSLLVTHPLVLYAEACPDLEPPLGVGLAAVRGVWRGVGAAQARPPNMPSRTTLRLRLTMGGVGTAAVH